MTDLIKLSTRGARFAVCVDNGGYAASLERWKIYRVLPDRDAERHHMVRVADESGEDYIYPRNRFKLGTLPIRLRRLYPAQAQA
jgi:hypothetical protein